MYCGGGPHLSASLDRCSAVLVAMVACVLESSSRVMFVSSLLAIRDKVHAMQAAGLMAWVVDAVVINVTYPSHSTLQVFSMFAMFSLVECASICMLSGTCDTCSCVSECRCQWSSLMRQSTACFAVVSCWQYMLMSDMRVS